MSWEDMISKELKGWRGDWEGFTNDFKVGAAQCETCIEGEPPDWSMKLCVIHYSDEYGNDAVCLEHLGLVRK